MLFVQFFMQFFNFNEYFIKCNKFKQILRMKVEERKPLFLVWNYSVVVGWEPEGYDDISTMFQWEPEGCYRHWLLYSNNALLILNRTLLNSDNALLALNWRCDNRMFLHNLESIRTIQEYELQHHTFLITITKLCKEIFRPKRWIKMVLTILAPFSLSSNVFKDYGCVYTYFAKAESAFWNADSKRRSKTPLIQAIVRAQVNRKGIYMTSFKRGYMWFCVHASTRISVLL